MKEVLENGLAAGVAGTAGVGAVAVSGVSGLSAVGISTGLVALGGSMAMGLGVVAIIGAGSFIAVKKLFSWIG